MSALNLGNPHSPSQRSASPQPISRFAQTSDKQSPILPYRPLYDFAPNFPRIGQFNHNSKAFSIRQSTPLSSRSPSVASWCSFDSDYEDGLVIEEIDSDDENLDDSSVEVIEGEYEDPPSDDEYWDRWRYRQQQDYNQNVIISGVGELSAGAPTLAFLSSQPLYIPPTSPAPSTGSKRSFREAGTDEEETDREDNHSSSGRRTRRRLTRKAPSPLSRPVTAQVTRNYASHIFDESEMEE